MENKMHHSPLWDLGYKTIRELETEQGILASGKEEIYGCIFGRDSLITSLELMKAYERTKDDYFLGLVKKILLNLGDLQGKTINIESGEEPGKCIHEFRPANHEHLTKSLATPWYVYPDHMMRNYDTVDATPLFLIAVHEFYSLSHDGDFLNRIMPKVYLALDWLLTYGDSNHDGFIDYRFHPDRTYGGLRTQSWMDSSESVFHAGGEAVVYPIAPVEVQAYAYAALRRWGDYFTVSYPVLRRRLMLRATRLKNLFNRKFVIRNGSEVSLAYAIDGNGKLLTAPRSSMGHVLWAIGRRRGGAPDGILENASIPGLVSRLLSPDLFEPEAGIRTLGVLSENFDPKSYHNGSIWPHDTSILIEGFENYGYRREAARVRRALLSAYEYFQTPIELFVFTDGHYSEYRSEAGQAACRKQAWSAAAMLAESILP